MSNITKFNQFAEDLGKKVHNLATDTLKVMLTNTAPLAANAVKADITEIAAGNGYSAGGSPLTGQAFAQSAGVGKLLANLLVFTASVGNIAPFRYAVLYNSTPAAGPLIGYWDYGSAVTLNANENITLESPALGNWDAANPILSIG